MKLLIVFFVLACALCSCQYSNYTYIQTPLNVPHLKKKGNAEAEAYGSVRGVDVQGAYALSDRVGVMANVNGMHNVFSLDVGAGYYGGKKKYTYSVFGGVGFGDLSIQGSNHVPFSNDDNEWNNHSHYQKIFAQVALTKKVAERFDLSLAVRTSYVRFDSYSYTYHQTSEQDRRKLKEYIDTVEIRSPASALVIDPALIFTLLPEKRFSFYAQVGCAFPIAFDELAEDHTVDFSGYTTKGTYVVSSEQAPHTNQPVMIPVSMYGGIRWNISKKR